MAKNILVINVDFREVRVALIENGIIAEFHIERASQERCFGDVVLGKVSRVLPGMQAAFIDVGLEKAAFLHVEDLIRPDDFEAYLSGRKRSERHDDDPAHDAALRAAKDAPKRAEKALPPAAHDAPASAEHAHPHVPDAPPSVAVVEAPPSVSVEELEVHPEAEVEAVATETETAATEKHVEGEPTPDAEVIATGAEETVDVSGDANEDDLGDSPPGEAGAKDEGAEAKGPGGRRRRRRRGGAAKETQPQQAKAPPPPPPQQQQQQQQRGDRGDRGRGGSSGGNPKKGAQSSRIDKHTPIRDVVREGQQVLVQISKEPMGTKGARVTSHITLPGRYVVYLPTVDYIGISKRIGDARERQRLREAIEGMRPPSGGLIVRTVAEGLTKKQLKADVGYLVRLWGEIAKQREGARAPALVYQELDLVLKVARDMFTDEVSQIVIDDKAQFDRLVRFVEMFMPERVKDIVLYQGDEPIFDEYGIEEEIKRSLARKVPLPSGGGLIIDEAEALTAIDVNTGRFVGKGSKDHEETILKANLEAVEEIAYQLRFRNLGGLIVLDLIDMERAQSREIVRRRLEELLLKDKAKTSLNRISELGLIEMTRKRTRESLGRLLHEPCEYCDGTGQITSKTTTVYEILRAIRRDRSNLAGYTVVVSCHPDVIALMKGDERAAVQEAEKKFMRRIDFVPRKEYHLEQFDLVGK